MTMSHTNNAMEGMYSLGSGFQHQASGAVKRSGGGCAIDPFRCLRPYFLCPSSTITCSKLTRITIVLIKLYPLDPSEDSEPRSFSLTKERREIDVGRASRNPDRGPHAASDNATFKCPIMSRLHARFTASPVEKVRGIPFGLSSFVV